MFIFIDAPIQDIFYSVSGYRIYGLGLLTILVFLVVAGYLGSTIVMSAILKKGEVLLYKIPLVKEIYKSIKDVFGAFISDKKKFDKAVIVEVVPGVNRVGFITNKDMSSIGIPNLLAVYFPLSYAFTGELLFIESRLIKELPSEHVSDIFKLLISGGIIEKKSDHDPEE
jgi:uncharacterized membrane protein